MLDDFSKSKKGYSLILSDMQEKIQKIQNSAAAATGIKIMGSGQPSLDGGSGGGTSISNSDVLRSSPNLPTSSQFATPEQAMNALMSEYEKELQTPVKGILFGSLMTAMLIQMQKLKVHTEAAMLTMDQILKSNELTIAGMAAMPAFALIGFILYSIRNALRPLSSSRTRGVVTSHFRLIMSDVERSLYEVYDIVGGANLHAYLSTSNCDTSMESNGKHNHNHTMDNQDILEIDEINHTSNTHTLKTMSSGVNISQKTKRLQAAHGMLCFNLVRLRSEFHHLFMGYMGTGRSSSLSASSINIKQLNSNSNHTSLLYHSSTNSHYRHGAISAAMKKIRLVRQNSISKSNSFSTPAGASQSSSSSSFGPVGINLPTFRYQCIGIYNVYDYICSSIQSIMMMRANTTNNYNSSSGSSSNTAAIANSDVDDTAALLLSTILDQQNDQSFTTYSTNLYKALYNLIFGSQELLTSTTQSSSLHRDIALLEAPEFEVSLERKIATANRMRLSYNCLLPSVN